MVENPKVRSRNRDFLTTSEAAAQMQVSGFTIRRWCELGLLGGRIGGRWRITPEQICQFELRGLPKER